LSIAVLDELNRKKQLGQYFTERRVARLLAALARADGAKSIIDPMVGSGDLLAACVEVGARPDALVGLDLDPQAINQAHAVLAGNRGVQLTATDAFSASLSPEQFDLVITNPPYIRYQSKGEVDGIAVPSASTVRAHLTKQIEGRTALTPQARALFLRAASTYPGTADVAVPAWILSAALVREGGYLAVVAPQAWLSRNYAHAVRDLIDQVFDVEILVEDGDASWFEDAQVRTQLVIARRRAIDRHKRHSLVAARATRSLDTGGSLVGSHKSEHDVAAALRRVNSLEPVTVTTGLKARVSHDVSLAASGRGGTLAPSIAAAIGPGSAPPFRTFETYGWRVGQGLRTGANDFFYLAEVEGQLRSAERWGPISLDVPEACLEPAVRRQNDLGERLDVTEETPLASRVLNLRGWVTASDSKRAGISGMRVLPESVSTWISHVGLSPLSDADSSKTFPKLTAVATNAKKDREGRPIGFWYQLPPLAPRHRPTVFLPRVCGGRPFAYLNSAGALIDANFSSLWPIDEDALPVAALFALLNSTWTWANLEVSSTILGGGALKVEATDLRRLPLPDLDKVAVGKLSELGKKLRLRTNRKVLDEIDSVIAETIVGTAGKSRETTRRLIETAEHALMSRSREKLQD
jgi:predicted RNA methylase